MEEPTMKRLFLNITIILTVTIGMLTGCSETIFENNELVQGDALTATIANDNGTATRTVMIDNPGQKVALTWKSGDRIGITPKGGGQNLAFTTTGADISSDGCSASFKSVSNIPSGQLMAYYPYEEGAQTGDGTLTLTMHHSQRYTTVRNVSEPDATAFAMVGKGSKDGGIVLHNLFSLLKFGYRSQDSITIREVRFRDLSNTAVSGTYQVTWSNDEPVVQFTGTASDDRLLTLTFNSGVLIPSGQARVFFLVVPARRYEKGFEVTLITNDGEQIVKTVGTNSGKTLQRNLVYPIGDVLENLDMSNINYTLQPQTHLVDNNNIDQIYDITLKGSRQVRDDGGSKVSLFNYDFLVDKAMNLKNDDYLVINQPSEVFPNGFTGKVVNTYQSADNTFAKVEQLENPLEAFKSVTIGKQLYDSEGVETDDGGIDLDLASYLMEIKTEDGEDVPFTIENGRIYLNEQMTRAIIAKKFDLPELSIQFASADNGSITAGFQLEFTTKMSLGYYDGSFDYFHFNVYPRLNTKVDFTLEKSAEATMSKHLVTLVFAPIGVPPIMITPEVDISAYISAGCSLSLTGTIKYRADWGSFGMSYNKGNGFVTRRGFGQPDEEAGFQPPELDAKAELGIEAGLQFSPTLSLYGLLKMGMHNSIGLKLSTEYHAISVTDGASIKLTPTFKLEPFAASLGGLFTHTFKDLASIEFDPIWQRDFLPNLEIEQGTHFNYKTTTDSIWETHFEVPINGKNYVFNFDDPKKVAIENYTYNYTFKGDMLCDVGIAMEIYEREGREYSINPWYVETVGPSGEDYCKAILAAGLGEYSFYYSDILIENTGERRLVKTIDIGTFSGNKDGEGESFQGTLDYSFSNGVPYEMDLVVYLKSFPSVRVVYSSAGGYCNWPYMSNGQIWPKKPEAEQ